MVGGLKGEVDGAGALEVFEGRVFPPNRNPLEAEVETFFLGGAAEGGFRLPGEGRFELVFGDDAAGEGSFVEPPLICRLLSMYYQ
jgi:hypothetical protein